jgi:hypothetical protein
MSTYIRPNVFVVIEQLSGQFAPRPLPLENHFSEGKRYEILGLHCPSETGEAYCILKNDLDQMWFISNRHLRIVEPQVDLTTLGYSNGKVSSLVTH